MKKNDLMAYLILIVVASITTLLGLYIGGLTNEANKRVVIEKNISRDINEKIKQRAEEIKELEEKIKTSEELWQKALPSELPDYSAIKGANPNPNIRNIKISSECHLGGCVNDKPATVNFDGIKKSYKSRGQFSRAYLYIDALVDYDRPLTSWDDIYFVVNLIPDSNTLPVPAGKTSQYLYNLSSISYFPTIKDKEMNKNKRDNTDFFRLLKYENRINIYTSVSSNRPGRVIKEISIFYECFEGSDCLIEELK